MSPGSRTVRFDRLCGPANGYTETLPGRPPTGLQSWLPMTGGHPRIGHGFDAHRLGGAPPLKLAGVVVDTSQGLVATSDGDAVAHAVADALLGAASLGDVGKLFPSGDERWRGADSMELLARVVELLGVEGMGVGNIDVTVIAERVRISPHRDLMRRRLATVLGTGTDQVSVKATTTDGMGFAGRGEGIAASAVVLLVPVPHVPSSSSSGD